ncbi:MAG: hypothetical protein ABIR55_05305 [Burkholderiaceae bacterium]
MHFALTGVPFQPRSGIVTGVWPGGGLLAAQRHERPDDLPLPHFLDHVLRAVPQVDGSGLEERPRRSATQRRRIGPVDALRRLDADARDTGAERERVRLVTLRAPESSPSGDTVATKFRMWCLWWVNAGGLAVALVKAGGWL